MSDDQLNAFQLAALEAIGEGRVPQDEAFIAKLKRRGLVERAILAPRDLYLTPAGREALGR